MELLKGKLDEWSIKLGHATSGSASKPASAVPSGAAPDAAPQGTPSGGDPSPPSATAAAAAASAVGASAAPASGQGTNTVDLRRLSGKWLLGVAPALFEHVDTPTLDALVKGAVT